MSSSPLRSERAHRLPKLMVCGAWPPAVGGAVAFAVRLEANPLIGQSFEIVRHSILKRPSMFVPEDSTRLSRGPYRVRKSLSALSNGITFLMRLLVDRPRVVQIHYNGPFQGPLFHEVCCYLAVARLFRVRTAVRQGGPFQFYETDPRSPIGSRIRSHYLSRIDVLLVQCDLWRERYAEWGRCAGVDTEIVTIPNTVDVQAITPAQKEPAEPTSQPVPFFFGAVAGPQTRIKGGHILLDALEHLSRITAPGSFRLSVISETQSFRDAVRARQLDGLVMFEGLVSGASRARWMRKLDAFVLPSLREGFPNIVLEMMAAGVPVLAAPVGAVPSVISHDTNGLLFDLADSEALALEVRRLMTSPDLRARLAKEARFTVESAYSHDGPWASHLIECYQRIIRNKRRSGGA